MAPMSLMAVSKKPWDCLPTEIRRMILEVILRDGCNLASFATVSREWQTIIERHNFARIKLTPSRLADFHSIVHRNRGLVSYIWLCLELGEYDCTQCVPPDPDTLAISNTDNTLITKALQDLFSTLSAWEPNGDLLLDISVHSPSDSEHWFKYLTFEPDNPSDEHRWAEQAKLFKEDDHKHGWIAGRQDSAAPDDAIYNVFEEIMCEGPFDSEEQEMQWWQQLPSIPVVTGVLLRQQNRRRWKPRALAQMFAHFPRLQEIHYEPWREWNWPQQGLADDAYRSLFESLASTKLRRLVLFENFNQKYPSSIRECEPFRIPDSDVARMVANASVKLEHLSASFIVDASYFFPPCDYPWVWLNLTSLAITSRLLTPDENPFEIDRMLQAAAAAAVKMPKLEAMEIWNGREGLAALFRYQSMGVGQPAVVTWRGTWEFALQPSVIRVWEAAALKHSCSGIFIVKELLNVGTVVRSHADAIHYLQLSNSVIRPISLHQIRMEQRIREGVQSW